MFSGHTQIQCSLKLEAAFLLPENERQFSRVHQTTFCHFYCLLVCEYLDVGWWTGSQSAIVGQQVSSRSWFIRRKADKSVLLGWSKLGWSTQYFRVSYRFLPLFMEYSVKKGLWVLEQRVLIYCEVEEFLNNGGRINILLYTTSQLLRNHIGVVHELHLNGLSKSCFYRSKKWSILNGHMVHWLTGHYCTARKHTRSFYVFWTILIFLLNFAYIRQIRIVSAQFRNNPVSGMVT